MKTPSKTDVIWAIFFQEIPEDSLRKGGFIPAEIVEKVTGTNSSDYSFRFRQLELRARIEDHFATNGETVTVKCENFGLRILTDSEATKYNADLFKQRLRGTFESHRKMMGLDTAQLTDEEKEAHDRRIIAQGKILQSISTTNQEVKLIPYRREMNNA